MGRIIQNLFISFCTLASTAAIGWINVIYNYIVINSVFGFKCSWEEHRRKVEFVQKQVKVWAQGDKKKKLVSSRPGWKSISTNKVNKSPYYQIELSNLNDVIEINETNQTITVEPGMTMGRLSRILIPRGWTIPVFPELESLTVGGLIAGLGIETGSHKYSLFHTTAVEYEIVMPNGAVATCSKKNDPDLYYAIPGSYATIGFITAVTLQLIPAKKYVQLDYHFTSSIESTLALIKEEGSKHDFIEGLAFSNQDFAVMFANMVDEPSDPNKINYINGWYKTFFFLQVQNVINGLKRSGQESVHTEFIPLVDYYHRHSRGVFWEFKHMSPYLYDKQFYMFIIGWVGAVNTDLQRLVPKWLFKKWFAYHIIQDYVVPMENTAELFHEGDRMLKIYPIWICPCKVEINPDCFKYPEKYSNAHYIDLGYYGEANNSKMDKKSLLRHFEKLCIKLQGFQILYADCFMSKNELETMFDFTLYNKVRKERGCEAAFPHIYEKVCAKARDLEGSDESNYLIKKKA